MKSLSDVMPDNGGIIAGVAEDNSGDMWVTSARQLIHLNVTKGDTGEYQFVPHVYNDKDGLQNCDFNLRSIRELNNGAILLGGLYGINVFSPEMSVIINYFLRCCLLVFHCSTKKYK